MMIMMMTIVMIMLMIMMMMITTMMMVMTTMMMVMTTMITTMMMMTTTMIMMIITTTITVIIMHRREEQSGVWETCYFCGFLPSLGQWRSCYPLVDTTSTDEVLDRQTDGPPTLRTDQLLPWQSNHKKERWPHRVQCISPTTPKTSELANASAFKNRWVGGHWSSGGKVDGISTRQQNVHFSFLTLCPRTAAAYSLLQTCYCKGSKTGRPRTWEAACREGTGPLWKYLRPLQRAPAERRGHGPCHVCTRRLQPADISWTSWLGLGGRKKHWRSLPAWNPLPFSRWGTLVTHSNHTKKKRNEPPFLKMNGKVKGHE